MDPVGWSAFPRQKLDLLHKSADVDWLHLQPPKDENMLVSMPGGIEHRKQQVIQKS